MALAAAWATLSLAAPPVNSQAVGPSALLVGPPGTPGAQYGSIQAAVDAARPGDWILVAPGVYHEHGSPRAGVLIQKSNIHLRGMSRTGVIVDGTRASAGQRSGSLPPGSPACSNAPALQDFGEKDSTGKYVGQNGIEVLGFSGDHDHFVGHLADDVSIENLTVCNYHKVQEAGNQIWWNGGDGKGLIGMSGFRGDYISATDTYYEKPGGPVGSYGIFTSDEGGPGVIDHSYASNMEDSSYYIGACRNCGVVLDHAHGESSALGLSSTNAGGNLVVQNGEWNDNRVGLVSNAQNNDDYPSPEYGQCVAPSVPPPGAGPNSCYVIRGNFIHDNNNPNTAGHGLTSSGAIGTGVELVATQHVSVIDNRIENQGSWGVFTHFLPDPEDGPAQCNGGIQTTVPVVGVVCTFFSRGNFVARNQFKGGGFFGNVTNADIANQDSGVNFAPSDQYGGAPDANCFQANALTSPTPEWPPMLQESTCPPGLFDSTVLLAQLACATDFPSLATGGAVGTPCPNPLGYPQRDFTCKAPAVLTPAGDTSNGICLVPASRTLSAQVSPSMPDPCAGAPANAYCPVAAGAPPSPSPPGLPLTSSVPPPASPTPVVLVGAALLLVIFLYQRKYRRRPR